MRQHLFRGFRALLRLLSLGYLRTRIEGLEHLPAHGGVLVASNHPSVLDGILLLAVSPRPVRFLVAEDMYEHSLLKPLFRVLGCIPVLRRGARNGDALQAAVEALNAGEVIGIFPEGTIHYGGSLSQLRPGVALLALKTGVPVVPLGIRGTGEAFPDGARWPRPGSVCLYFGRPHAYARLTGEHFPNEKVAYTLEDIRRRLLGVREVARMLSPSRMPPRSLKRLQVALTGLIVIPLAGLLTLTAHPSLDPVKLSPQGARP